MSPQTITPLIAVLRASNPGPMTLDGTRSYVLRAPGEAGCVVVDPGPEDEPHLRALVDAGPVELTLVTHRHADHTAGSARLHQLTGAPVRAADPEHCHGGGQPLTGRELMRAAGLDIEVVATPGHTADSVCFVVTDPRFGHAILTGDTVLGYGTTVIAEPDGSLSDYLTSLDAIERIAGDAPTLGLPGHGPVVDDLAQRVREYRAHRHERLAQVSVALESLGIRLPTHGEALDDDVVDRVTRAVYTEVEPTVLPAARQSVRAQLVHLATREDVDGRG